MLSLVQQEIVEQSGNMIVRASAGTGKTHTMVNKIAYDIKKNRTHKVVAAITFTIKAANEIKNRLTIDTTEHFIGTNNSFAIEEVVKPFIKDVFGKEYKVDMSTDYSVKVNTFAQGLVQIKEKGILGSYQDNTKNFIFQLALKILKDSKACQLYLQAKYFKIYVDEYQDCDKDMHEFFMYICEKLNIETFVVGDAKQSIYMWRGAYPKAFLSIWDKPNFSKNFMTDNYRSCQQIQNYSNLLCEETRHLFKPVNDISPVVVVCTSTNSWSKDILPYLDKSKRTALLRYSKANAESGADELSKVGIDITYIPPSPISDITTEVAWLYNAIAKYFVLSNYSVYDVRSEIPNEVIGNKKVLTYLKKSLANLDEDIKAEDYAMFVKQVDMLASYFGYETREEHCQKLYDSIVNERYHPAFKVDELDKISITFHSSKGLEFDQVVLFASDYRLSNEEGIDNHYVAATRAKSKLIIVYDGSWNAQKFAENINQILKQSDLSMRDIATVVNCSM